jgi:hypothetical protein
MYYHQSQARRFLRIMKRTIWIRQARTCSFYPIACIGTETTARYTLEGIDVYTFIWTDSSVILFGKQLSIECAIIARFKVEHIYILSLEFYIGYMITCTCGYKNFTVWYSKDLVNFQRKEKFDVLYS